MVGIQHKAENKSYQMLLSYGVKVNGVLQYSISECNADFLESMLDFLEEHHELVFDYNIFYNVLTKSVQLFRETVSVGQKTGSGRVAKCTSENIIKALLLMKIQKRR